MAIILANDGIAKDAKAKLESLGYTVDTNKYEDEALLNRLKEVDCIVVRSATKMRDPQIDAGASGNLKLIIRAGVGIDNINKDYAESKGLVVRNTPAASSNAVAELCMGQLFVLARNIHRANRTMAQGEWLKKEYSGCELAGKTLGIIGMGRIGRCLGEKAKALGMKVIYNDQIKADGWTFAEKDELVAQSDFISLHIPACEKPVIGKEEFAKMKDGVYILNAARGGVVDEEALLEAIESGKVAGAAIDAFSEEPLKNEKIMHCDRISMTPHIGAATKEAQDRIGEITVEIIEEVLGGK